MSSFPIPAGAVVLDHPTYTDADTNEIVGAAPTKQQPDSIAQNADGSWPFIRVGGVEKQFAPPAAPPTADQLTAAAIDAQLTTLDANLNRSTEDLWLALKGVPGFTASPYVQGILDQKAALRTQRAALKL